MDSKSPRAHRQQALAVYVEPLAVGRRVAVFGDASSGLGARLVELGARAVYAWDPDSERALEEANQAPRGLSVHAFAGDDFEARAGAFDLVVVADLLLFDEPEELLALARRMVGEEGVAVVAAPNREAQPERSGEEGAAFDYYELFDLVAREFQDVTMVAQLPFRGVTLAELGERTDESPVVSVDTQLAEPDRTPEAFLALASHRGVRLDPYAIVELPDPPPEVGPVAEVARAPSEPRWPLVETLESQIRDLRERLTEQEDEARVVPELEEALRDCSSRVTELEAALADTARELLQARSESQALRERSEKDVAGAVEAHAREVGRYEEALRDRARLVGGLEAEVGRRERMVRELVDALEESQERVAAEGRGAPAAAPASATTQAVEESVTEVVPEQDALREENAALAQKLDVLALEMARREGEAHASLWTIAELERRLEAHDGAPPAPSPAPQPDQGDRLAAVLDELDVLRRALAQEHEARLRAESGEELAHARAEIERQAMLLEALQDRAH